MATNELQLVGGRNYKAISCALQLLITKDYQVNKIAQNPPHTLSKRTVTSKIKLQPVRRTQISYLQKPTLHLTEVLPFKVSPSQKNCRMLYPKWFCNRLLQLNFFLQMLGT